MITFHVDVLLHNAHIHTYIHTYVWQANALYLKGMFMGELELLLCPKSADEKRVWLEKLQRAG